jgi:preprotein translocase subunit SecY
VQRLLTNDVWWAQLLMIITLTAGTGLIMWFAELVTERGVGNGMSILIFTSIAAQFPGGHVGDRHVARLRGLPARAGRRHRRRRPRRLRRAVAARIPVQYAKRMVGRRTLGGTNTYIPIKVNMAGVVPVIFASSLLYIPALIAQFNQTPDANGNIPAG